MPWRNEVANYCSMMVGIVHLMVAFWAMMAVTGFVHPSSDSLSALLMVATGTSGAARVGTQMAGLEH